MANLPSLLKEAILEQDWSKVNSAYEMLTGEAISHEKIVDAQLPQEEPESPQQENTRESHIAKSYKDDAPYDSTNSQGAARKQPMNLESREPQWVDDGSIAAGEMVSKNPSLGVANPVARNRKPVKKQKPSTSSDIRLDQSSKLKNE